MTQSQCLPLDGNLRPSCYIYFLPQIGWLVMYMKAVYISIQTQAVYKEL